MEGQNMPADDRSPDLRIACVARQGGLRVGLFPAFVYHRDKVTGKLRRQARG
jgi:hypothetical protein